MKPPREPARYTDEDWRIMQAATIRWFSRHGPDCKLAQIYVPADRADAALMYTCQDARAACDRAGVLHCLIPWDRLVVEGFDDPDIGVFEQGLAVLLPKLPDRYR